MASYTTHPNSIISSFLPFPTLSLKKTTIPLFPSALTNLSFSTQPQRFRCFAGSSSKGVPGVKEEKWVQEGLITESLPNGMFRVKLDNQDLVLGHVSGRIRKSFVRILPGDRVRIEVSRYDSTRGRIVYRLRNSKDSST